MALHKVCCEYQYQIFWLPKSVSYSMLNDNVVWMTALHRVYVENTYVLPSFLFHVAHIGYGVSDMGDVDLEYDATVLEK